MIVYIHLQYESIYLSNKTYIYIYHSPTNFIAVKLVILYRLMGIFNSNEFHT